MDVSSKLGEYMLKGWVLTDETCPTEGCPVPLMRSPKGHAPLTTFCVRCDGSPEIRRESTAKSLDRSQPPLRQPSPSITHSTSTHLSRSRSSTPPTDISSALSSPTFAPPVDTAESIRWREQSDAASAEIAKRLLKGWAMLADECINPRCFGVPLVRPPIIGGGKDPRKECVACGTVYVDEKDAMGWDRLVALSTPESSSPVITNVNESATSSSVQAVQVPATSSAAPSSEHNRNIATGLAFDTIISASTSEHTQRNGLTITTNPNFKKSEDSSALEVTALSLEQALRSLSQKLTTLSSQPASIEPLALGNTADAIGKVLQALGQVKRLRGDGVAIES